MATGSLGLGSGSGSTRSLPSPRPKSPPDLYGRRKDITRLQMLEREKGYLEDELKFVERLQPASRCCKEVVDFVSANSDPIIPANRKIRKSRQLWKWLCGSSCFSLSWVCCCTGFSANLKMPGLCCCRSKDCCTCSDCSLATCSCCFKSCFCCCSKNECHESCCSFKSIPCSNCCSYNCKCSCLKCLSCSELCTCFGYLKYCCCCKSCCVCC